MDKTRFFLIAGLGFSVLVLLLIAAVAVVLLIPTGTESSVGAVSEATSIPGMAATQEVIPTFTPQQVISEPQQA
jgi:hypothetical protein